MSNSPGSDRLQIHKPKSNSPSAPPLVGMEQSLPPSKAVQKKSSQSPNHYKPLPPPPLGRQTSLSPPRHRSTSEEAGGRRTSSIYCRTVSAWYSSELPPDIPSLTEHPVPKISSIYKDPIITPLATMSEPQLLLPRTYSPPISSPSSTVVTEESPKPPPKDQRPSALLPLPIPYPHLPETHLRTVSLEKAQAARDAPGEEHLLPEELRARTIAKARSSEHIAKLTDQLDDKPQKPGSAHKASKPINLRLPSMMMLDAEIWHKFDPSLYRGEELDPKTTLVNAAQIDTRWSGSTAIPMSRDQSQTGSASTPEVTVDEPERGRTLHRLPRKAVKGHTAQAPSDANKMAAEYSLLLSTQWTNSPSASPGYRSQTGVELKPEPLFAYKPVAGPPGTMQTKHDRSALSSISPKGRTTTTTTTTQDWDSDDSLAGTPPPPGFFFSDTEDDAEQSQNHSRTGSIPISPPSAFPLPPQPATAQGTKGSALSNEAKPHYRESAYYPYVGRRRYGKSKHKAAKSDPTPSSGVAMDTARAPQKKPAVKTDLISKATNKIADKLARPSDETTPASPATLGQSVTGVYLGWSEESKEDFDASKPMSPKLHYATGKYGARPVVKPTYTHIVTPARPLDERAVGLSDSETKRPGHTRKTSLLGSLLEMSREKGREKRREDIKKTIKLIPNAPASASSRPSLETKSVSDAEIRTQANSTAPPRGLWGRRISEFGLI